MYYLDNLLIEEAVDTVASEEVSAALYRDFVFTHLLGAAIATGSIVVVIEFQTLTGWHELEKFTIDSSGSDPALPAFYDRLPVTSLRARITTHNAEDAGSDPVAFSLAVSGK